MISCLCKNIFLHFFNWYLSCKSSLWNCTRLPFVKFYMFVPGPVTIAHFGRSPKSYKKKKATALHIPVLDASWLTVCTCFLLLRFPFPFLPPHSFASYFHKMPNCIRASCYNGGIWILCGLTLWALKVLTVFILEPCCAFPASLLLNHRWFWARHSFTIVSLLKFCK